jgi:hypothetical protein
MQRVGLITCAGVTIVTGVWSIELISHICCWVMLVL